MHPATAFAPGMDTTSGHIKDSERFQQLLADVLPDGLSFELIHLRSQPKRCVKLVFTSSKDPRLDAVSHNWLLLKYEDVFVYGLEVLVYNSEKHTTIFVSKADTTGFYNGKTKLNFKSITSALITGMAEYYAVPHKLVRVCLFARTNPYYLFSGSDKNPRKHVLKDAQLYKWWLLCLDTVATSLKLAKCKLLIPGDLGSEITHALALPLANKWSKGSIFDPEDPEELEKALAVHYIPRFPDDPKHRFLDDIVANHFAKKTTLQRFWIELDSRQEINLSSAVGILGLEGYAARSTVIDGTYSVDCKYTNSLEEVLLSSLWETESDAKKSTESILAKTPRCAILGVVGKHIDTAPKVKRELPVANMLGGSLIKKKSKKQSS